MGCAEFAMFVVTTDGSGRALPLRARAPKMLLFVTVVTEPLCTIHHKAQEKAGKAMSGPT
jgi:hypothetical protein